MKIFEISGEYGIHPDEVIRKTIKAKNSEKAIQTFIEFVKKQYPVQWIRMGKSNIYVQ